MRLLSAAFWRAMRWLLSRCVNATGGTKALEGVCIQDFRVTCNTRDTTSALRLESVMSVSAFLVRPS